MNVDRTELDRVEEATAMRTGVSTEFLELLAMAHNARAASQRARMASREVRERLKASISSLRLLRLNRKRLIAEQV